MKATTTAATLLTLSLATLVSAQEPTFRVVVALNVGAEEDPTRQQAAMQAAKRRVIRSLDSQEVRVSRVYSTVPAFAAVVTRKGWTSLSAEPDVARVDLDEAAELTKSTVGSTAQSLKLDKMGLTGKGVTVALIDSGVDSSHPDLAGVIEDEACFCVNAKGQPCCPNGTSRQLGMGAARDDNGHGTHIAGIIAGRGRTAPKGLAPNAYIIAIRIADQDGSLSTGSMLDALDWLAVSHPDVQVVNMSLGTTATYAGSCDSASATTSSLAAAGLVLRKHGTVIVAAAGNAGSTDRMMAPACVTGFLSVGAVYSRSERVATSNGCTDVKTKEDRVACFSNSSSALDLLAPGAGIISTGRGGGQAIASGTSQAAAVVSGAAALLFEGAGSRGGQIDAALRGGGVSLTDPRNGRSTPRVNVRAALAALAAL